MEQCYLFSAYNTGKKSQKAKVTITFFHQSFQETACSTTYILSATLSTEETIYQEETLLQ